MKSIVIAVLLALASVASAEIIISIEEPVQDGVHQGIGNIRGWAVSDAPIIATRHYINGVDKGTIPYGGRRGDVGARFPEWPDADLSGFSRTFAWSLLDDDRENEVTVQFLNSNGEIAEQSVSFRTARFNGQTEFEKTAVLDFASFLPSENGFILENVLLNGVFYPEVTWEWSNDSQKFEIVNVED